MKTQDVRIDEELSHKIWERGVRSPPRKIRVIMEKTDEGFIRVSPYDESVGSKEADAQKVVTQEDDKESGDVPELQADEPETSEKSGIDAAPDQPEEKPELQSEELEEPKTDTPSDEPKLQADKSTEKPETSETKTDAPPEKPDAPAEKSGSQEEPPKDAPAKKSDSKKD